MYIVSLTDCTTCPRAINALSYCTNGLALLCRRHSSFNGSVCKYGSRAMFKRKSRHVFTRSRENRFSHKFCSLQWSERDFPGRWVTHHEESGFVAVRDCGALHSMRLIVRLDHRGKIAVAFVYPETIRAEIISNPWNNGRSSRRYIWQLTSI